MNASGQSGIRFEPGPEGVQIYWNGRPLLGPQPVSGQSRRLPVQPQKQTLYLLQSPLLGEGIHSFLHNLPMDSAVILLEFEPDLAALKDHPAAVTVGTKGSWITGERSFIPEAKASIRRRGIRRVSSLSLSGAARFHRESYTNCEHHAEKLVRTFWDNRGTEIRLGRRWISNIWKNATADVADLTPLRRLFSGAALLIAAGPSLDFSLSYIRKAHASGIPLVAIDTALPALAAAQIPVDVIIALDGQLANAADLMPWQWDRTFLVADVSSHHAMITSFPGNRRHLICTRFSDLALFDSSLLTGFSRFLPRGSVGPTAVEILYRLFGVKNIVGAGFDFWYRLPRTHASLAMHHRTYLASAGRLDGNDGPSSRINRPWKRDVLDDGSPAVIDEILASQAQQFSELLESLSKNDPEFRFVRLPGRGISAGCERLSRAEAESWLTENGHISTRQTSPSRETGESIIAGDSESGINQPVTSRHHRIQSLLEIYNSLIAQEKVLADPARSLFLDATLEYAWFDLPQWPLLSLKREWAELHRPRLLQAVRDHRRRVQRSIMATGVIPRDFP